MFDSLSTRLQDGFKSLRGETRLTPELIESIIGLIPDSWLADEPFFADRDAHRAAYVSYLLSRLAEPRTFVEEALDARAQLRLEVRLPGKLWPHAQHFQPVTSLLVESQDPVAETIARL